MMALFTVTNGKGLFGKGANFLASLIESDSDSAEFVSIESPSIEYQETEPYKLPAHLLLVPQIHILPSPLSILNLEQQIDQCKETNSSVRPPHLCQSRNGEYFLRCIQVTRCSLVTISSRGISLLLECPPPNVHSLLTSLITKAENIASNTLGDFQQLCRENINPIRGKRRPVSAKLESEWCKISHAVNELSKRFDEVDRLFDEHGWKQE